MTANDLPRFRILILDKIHKIYVHAKKFYLDFGQPLNGKSGLCTKREMSVNQLVMNVCKQLTVLLVVSNVVRPKQSTRVLRGFKAWFGCVRPQRPAVTDQPFKYADRCIFLMNI